MLWGIGGLAGFRLDVDDVYICTFQYSGFHCKPYSPNSDVFKMEQNITKPDSKSPYISSTTFHILFSIFLSNRMFHSVVAYIHLMFHISLDVYNSTYVQQYKPFHIQCSYILSHTRFYTQELFELLYTNVFKDKWRL